MSSFGAQISRVRDADLVIGAHGAGLAHLMYARAGCSAAISIRNRGNSDIFAHLSLTAGFEFHHLLWRYDVCVMFAHLTNAKKRAALSCGRDPPHTLRLLGAAQERAPRRHHEAGLRHWTASPWSAALRSASYWSADGVQREEVTP